MKKILKCASKTDFPGAINLLVDLTLMKILKNKSWVPLLLMNGAKKNIKKMTMGKYKAMLMTVISWVNISFTGRSLE